jgi:hypothetical protein
LETWSLIAAGKGSLNAGYLCSSCGAEFDDDGGALKLVASSGKLSALVNGSTSLENWHRKA